MRPAPEAEVEYAHFDEVSHRYWDELAAQPNQQPSFETSEMASFWAADVDWLDRFSDE